MLSETYSLLNQKFTVLVIPVFAQIVSGLT